MTLLPIFAVVLMLAGMVLGLISHGVGAWLFAAGAGLELAGWVVAMWADRGDKP